MDSAINKLKAVLQKLKGNKKGEILLAAVIVIVVLIVFFASSGLFKRESDSKTVVTTIVSEEDAVDKLERRLSEIIAKMDGVGKADVMITVTGTTEKVTANTVTTNVSGSKTGQNETNSTSTTNSPVLVNSGGKSEPYVVKELMPDIIGVIVVAKNAENSATKLAILRAVETALNVTADRVEIYPMN